MVRSVYLYRVSSTLTNVTPDYCNCWGIVCACTWISVDYLLHEPIDNQYFNQGVEKIDEGNYRGAIDDWSKAIEINPQDADAYYNRDIAKTNLGDYQGAIDDYTKAIEINPQFAFPTTIVVLTTII